eukprot:TRINITY_DN53_c0_g2_i1.p1 TRINITY_DN53_c0_g2~~TRINITY_DN53_c0_g2_i1.p1  ORF type:complete len:209 (+),score=79.75 TRINITY_DN53_c0_g2_i1:60-629(+)
MTHVGTVKSWSDDKGFGFILPQNGGGDVFVHRKVQGMGMQTSLIPGKRVQYEFTIEKDKPKATLVQGEGVQKRNIQSHMPTAGRQIGIVKNWSQEKGYGFISPAYDTTSGDLFFLSNQVTGVMIPGQRVSYQVGVNPKTQKPWAESIVPEMIPNPYAYDPAVAAAAAGFAGYWPQAPATYSGLPGTFGY